MWKLLIVAVIAIVLQTSFADTNSVLSECHNYTSCTECASSPSPCTWCLERNFCTSTSEENCRNDILITSESVSPSFKTGPSFCPRMGPSTGLSPEIVIPRGLNLRIRVHVDQISSLITLSRFVCQFTIEDRFISVNAQLLGDSVYCDGVNFDYASEKPNVIAKMELVWGGNKVLDNPEDVHLLIYRCNKMAETARTCLDLEGKYMCGWCESSESCEVKQNCDSDSYVYPIGDKSMNKL